MNNNNTKSVNPNKTTKCDLIGLYSEVFEEYSENFEELKKDAYESVTKQIQIMYTLSNIVPNRMQTLTVTNSDANLSDEAKLKEKISHEIQNSFDKMMDENLFADFLNKNEIEEIKNINISEIIFDSIEIDSEVSNEKVAAVVGSFENKLVNIDIKNLLDISSFSVTDLIRSLVTLSLSAMDVVDVNTEAISINYFRLIPLIVLSAVTVYEKIVEPIDKNLYPLIYFIVTTKDIRDGVKRDKLVSDYIEANNEDVQYDEIINQISKLIDYNILKKDDDTLYLITDIKTKEINNHKG